MEEGSLLQGALRAMQKLRKHEQNLNFPLFEYPSQLGNSRDESCEVNLGTRNALVISLFCIDTQSDVNLDVPLHRKQLLRKLATIHNLVHTKIIPLYNKRYMHNWFTGGEGLCFGLHCQDLGDDIDDDSRGDKSVINQNRETLLKRHIPHLRAVVSYGPHPLDEFFALAMMKCISVDLYKHYKMKVAIECWDIDDGQILLIEGADYLPTWVDDIGVEGMAKRVYFVDGSICLLSPLIQCRNEEPNDLNCGKRTNILTRRQSLIALLENENKYACHNSPILKEFEIAIHRRLNPFCKVLNQSLDSNRIRSILGEYLHTAAIVLPLSLAILIRHRPDLISVAILSFCRYATDPPDTFKTKRDDNGASISNDSQNIAVIPFENLVYTSIRLPKTLYAMLLTAAGLLPPPMKTPKHYKSMELNRIKRQCKNGGVAYAHFRHAVEAGQRLSLGFEWIYRKKSSEPSPVDDPRVTAEAKAIQSLVSFSPEERISRYTTQMDIEAGGNGEWIKRAWTVGPNATEDIDKIDNLLNCPVWNPEILKGGISPIHHAGKSIAKHVEDAVSYARKRERSNKEGTGDFSVPRADEVDADDWIDLDSIDELEHVMNGIAGTSMNKDTIKDQHDGEKIMVMDAMMNSLEKFVSGSSDVRGITSDATNSIGKDADTCKTIDVEIDEEVYLQILQKAFNLGDLEELCLDDIITSREITSDNSSELLKYFSDDDMDYESGTFDDGGRGVTDTEMKKLMKTMDEQLVGEELDRTFDVVGEGEDGTGDDYIPIPIDDPTAARATVLTNILESLDAQGGSIGPVSTLLMETNSGPKAVLNVKQIDELDKM